MTTRERDDLRLLKPTDEVWSDVLSILETKLKKPTIQTWLKPAKLVSIEGDEAILAVSTDFMRTMVSNQLAAINEALAEAVGSTITARITIDPTLQADKYNSSIASIAVVSNQQAVHNHYAPANTATSSCSPSANHSTPSNHSVASNCSPTSNRVSASNNVSSSNRGAANQAARMSAFEPASSFTNTGSPTSFGQGLAEKAHLNPKYRFDSFVVGSHNSFCHSAALAVAQKPGEAYNPLFIYGGVGLGKTHIMQAIGHEVLSVWPHKTVRYITCERFMNELINAIQHSRQVDFRKRYRQVDVLLMDDIQFLAGKEQTQEEFFHTFNALRDSGRQIILSSDRPPKAMSTLEERLRSRFEWGLIADIQPPDLETRVAILRKKCEQENIKLSHESIEQIATMFTSNIRELEGALIRVNAYASLTGAPLDTRSLVALLRPEDRDKPRRVLSADDVIGAVAQHFRLEPAEIKSSRRSQDLTLPRHIAMHLSHELLDLSFPKIGQIFSNRKHSSVIYACDRIKDEIGKNPDLVATIRKIKQQLGV